jgi:hypothetical protein
LFHSPHHNCALLPNCDRGDCSPRGGIRTWPARTLCWLARVLAAFFAASCKPGSPLVRTTLTAALWRFSGPRWYKPVVKEPGGTRSCEALVSIHFLALEMLAAMVSVPFQTDPLHIRVVRSFVCSPSFCLSSAGVTEFLLDGLCSVQLQSLVARSCSMFSFTDVFNLSVNKLSCSGRRRLALLKILFSASDGSLFWHSVNPPLIRYHAGAFLIAKVASHARGTSSA